LQALRSDRTGALLRMTPAGEIPSLLGRAVVRRRPGHCGRRCGRHGCRDRHGWRGCGHLI